MHTKYRLRKKLKMNEEKNEYLSNKVLTEHLAKVREAFGITNNEVPNGKVLAKLESNSLYGKLGSKVKVVERNTYLKDGVLRFSDKDGCALKVRYLNGYPVDGEGERLPFVRSRKDADGDRELVYRIGDYFLVCLKKVSSPAYVEDGHGAVQFTIGSPKYTAAASFITAYSRRQVISTAQKNYGRGGFIYSDTDSVHLWKKDGRRVDEEKTNLSGGFLNCILW